MSLEVLLLAMLIYTSRHLMLIMLPFAMWSCILQHLFNFVCFLGGFLTIEDSVVIYFFQCQSFLLNSGLRQQQSCLLISHVIEVLILDPQAAR